MGPSTAFVYLVASILALYELQVVASSGEDYLSEANQHTVEQENDSPFRFTAKPSHSRHQQPVALSRADRIKLVLRRYLQDEQSLFNQHWMEEAPTFARIQTRSTNDNHQGEDASKQNAQAIIDKWLESTIFDLTKKSVQEGSSVSSADNKDPLEASPSGLSGLVGPSGLKTIRNIQPVIMRLPPRFGKRSAY